ncbi:hypothetical protein C0J52_25657 [Blattella germanica]|nr:hypothetical protein C0J52_25657 [Blattella germanica]
MKLLIKTKINPTAMKIGISSFKALKNGNLIIETEHKGDTRYGKKCVKTSMRILESPEMSLQRSRANNSTSFVGMLLAGPTAHKICCVLLNIVCFCSYGNGDAKGNFARGNKYVTKPQNSSPVEPNLISTPPSASKMKLSYLEKNVNVAAMKCNSECSEGLQYVTF